MASPQEQTSIQDRTLQHTYQLNCRFERITPWNILYFLSASNAARYALETEFGKGKAINSDWPRWLVGQLLLWRWQEW